MKRSLAILFALLLTLSTAPAVFAEDTGEAAPAEGQETIIEETVSEDAEPIVPEEETEILLIEEEADVLLADGTGEGTDAEETPTEEPVEEDRPTIPEETVGCTADVVTDGNKLLNNADNIFGTKPWDDNKDTTFDKAFDGDISTFYDAYNATIDAHVGMNVGTATQLKEVHIVPRNANGYDPEVEVLEGSGGFEYEDGNEFHNNLFDRDINSGWCQELTDEISEYYVIWKTSRPMEVLGYNLYTSYDTAEYPERNPIAWTLYGSVDGDEWSVIDKQEDNHDLPPENAALYSVYCPVETTDENDKTIEIPHPSYEYFKLTIDKVEGGIFQLGEFRLLESDVDCTRMEGMTIQGSNDGEFWANLYTFPDGQYYGAQPYVITADDMDFVNEYSFKQFRVINTQQHFNVAEVEFYGVEAAEDVEAYPSLPEGSDVLLTDDYAHFFGSESWSGNEENDGYYKAFDGETETFYDAYDNSVGNAEIGITLGNPAKLTSIRVYPRAEWSDRIINLTVQGSVSGNDWITLYQFPEDNYAEDEYAEVTEEMLASAAQDYAFTQFRVINKTDHLNVAEVEFYGTYDHGLETFPMVIEEPIYSYITADQFINSVWVHREENDPENPDDDHYLDFWYFNEEDEEGMTRFEREFEGRETIVLIGGVGFDDTVLDIQDIDGKPIIAVAPSAFVNENGIRKVIVNEYSDCKYIMNGAFAECHSIEIVEVSNALRNVESDAFRHNWNLREFIKNDDDLSDEDKDNRAWMFVEVIDGALVARADAVVCYPPAADNVPEYRVPDSVHHIDPWAFAGADIDKITMGHNVLRVNHGAFSDCTAHTIELSPALQYLGDHAFAGCTNLTSVLIPSDKVEINCWENGENGEREYNDDMFADTVDRESEESRADLVVKTYEGNMVHEYIDYIHSLELEDYDMSHVVFEEETETYWYGFDWWEECGENKVFLVGYSAPLDAEITTMPTKTYDGKTIIGIRTDGDAWRAFKNDSRIGGTEGVFEIPEGIKYIRNRPFGYNENLRTLKLPASLVEVDALNFEGYALEKFEVAADSEHYYTADNGASLYSGDTYVSFALGNGLETLEIADGTRWIGYSSFEGADSIKTVTVPETVESVDFAAFKDSSLESITLPRNVNYIGEEAFAECPNLTDVTIERLTGEFCSRDWNEDFSTVFADSPNVLVTVYAGSDAHRAAEEYGWNYKTVEVTKTVYDLYTANDGVHLRGVVPATGATEFVIPDEVQVIDDRAFAGKKITSVTFPKNLRYISHEAFAGCGDQFEINFAGIAQFGWEGSSFDNEEAFRQTYEAFIPDWHFDGKFAYVLAPSVKEAWIDAWWYTAVENGVMNVPADVTVDGVKYDVVLINGGALSEYAPRDRIGNERAEEMDLSTKWTYPKSIVLPETIRYIGGDAFAHHNYWDEENEVHNGLEAVDFPNSVQYISDAIFGNNTTLKSFTGLDVYSDVESSNPYRILDGCLVNVWDEHILMVYPRGSEAETYTTPAGIQGIGYKAFEWSNHLTHVTVSEGVRWLEHGSLDSQSLVSVELPSTLEEIGHGAFRFTRALEEVSFPNGNEWYHVGEDGIVREDGTTFALYPYALIPEDGVVVIPEDITGIKDGSMQGANQMIELVIPADVEWIGDWAFANSENLRKVIFEGTITDNMPIDIFGDCHNLEEIEYYGEYINLFLHNSDLGMDIATEHDENGNILHDEDGNWVDRKFDFRLMNKDAEVSLAVIRDDDWEHPDYDTMNPDDNPYFRLVRGTEPYFETYVAHDGVHLSGAYNMSGDIVIPENVMVIDDGVFAGMEIDSVTFPANLIRIGDRAFAGCDEFDVIATGGVQIGWQEDSFDFDFEKVYNEQIFTNNVLIDNILYRFTRTEGVNEAMVTAWWYDAVKDGVLNIPRTVDYDGVTYTVVSLEDGALSEYAPGYVRGEGFVAGDGEWTYPTSIVLPDTVRYVGYEAFGCHGYYTEERGDYGLESVTLPADILYINEGAFMDSYQIKEFKGLDAFGESENPYQLLDGAVVSAWRDDFNILLAYPPECGNIEYTVSGEIEMISNNAFKWAEELQTLTLEEGVVEIGDHAFMHCYSLQTLNLPASLEVINAAAFSHNNNLAEINIPKENEHFDLYDDGTLRADDGETLILYPVGTMEEPRVLNIPDDIRRITCVGLAGMGFTEIHVPASVEEIDEWAFENNGDLTKVVIHGNIGQMNMNVFAHDSSLKEVIFHGDHINLYYQGNENNWIDIVADNGKFDFVLVNEDAGISYSIQRGDNVNDRDYDTYGPGNNPHFRLIHGLADFTMYTADDGVHLQRVRNVSGDIVIPEEVMIIDDEAFKGIEITSVTFPPNLRSIGHRAFEGCGSFEVHFTGAAWIGREDDSFDEGMDFDAIYRTALLDNEHFDGNFLYYMMPEAKEAIVRGYWYTAIDDNHLMTIPSEVDYNGETYTVTAIEPRSCENGSADRLGDHVRWNAEEMGWTFEECEWTYPKTIVIPDTIRYIGEDAFAHHDYWDDETEGFVGLETVQLPKSVQWIERNAFNCCLRITSFTNLDAYGDEESSNPYRLTADGSIVNVWSEPVFYAYPCGKADTSYTIPDGIVGIGFAAFNNAANLVTVTIPEGVLWTDNESFAHCSNLETVYIPSTLENVSHGSFRGCNRLTGFILPQEAGEHFFIHEDGTLRSFDGKSIVVFPLGRVPEDGKLEISGDVEGIFGAAAAGSDRLTELVLPESIEWISDCAFEGSDNLRTVTIKRGENRELALNLNVFAWNPSLETIVYEGDVLELRAGDDLVVRNEKDEFGNDVFDENGNIIHIPFKLVVSEDCDVRCEDFDVNDNPHFNLLRGIPETVYGDVNGDGEATEDDALYLLRHTILSDRYPLSEGDHNYDESEDGEITAKDAVALKNIISNQ